MLQQSLFGTIGDFLVPESTVDRAEEEFGEQSRQSQHLDRQQRAPVTTDYSKWEDNSDRWDYPGVDTPTTDPQVLPKDLMTGDKPRTTEQETPDGRGMVDPLGSREREELQFGVEAQARDVSLSSDEGLRGVGAVGVTALGGFDPIKEREEDRPSTNAIRTGSVNAAQRAGLASGETADLAFTAAEEERLREQKQQPENVLMSYQVRANRGKESNVGFDF